MTPHRPGPAIPIAQQTVLKVSPHAYWAASGVPGSVPPSESRSHSSSWLTVAPSSTKLVILIDL